MSSLTAAVTNRKTGVNADLSFKNYSTGSNLQQSTSANDTAVSSSMKGQSSALMPRGLIMQQAAIA